MVNLWRSSMIFLLVLGLVIFGGCSKSDPTSPPPLPLPPSMSGEWIAPLPDGTQTFTLSLEEKENRLAGTGNLAGTLGGASGETSFPNVSIWFSSVGYIPIHFTGRFVGENMLQGVLNESGFRNFPINFLRSR